MRNSYRSLPRNIYEEPDRLSRYPDNPSSSNSDLEPDNFRSSRRLRLQNRNSPILRNPNLSNSLRSLDTSVNKALLDHQMPRNLNRTLDNATPDGRIPSQPAYNLRPFEPLNENLDPNDPLCQCPEDRPNYPYPKLRNSRPDLLRNSNPMYPPIGSPANYNSPLQRYPSNRPSYYPQNEHRPSEGSPYSSPNPYSYPNTSSRPQPYYRNPYPKPDPDYFVRSQLTKTPFHRQPFQPPVGADDCCDCSDDEAGDHYSDCPLCVIESDHYGHNDTIQDPYYSNY